MTGPAWWRARSPRERVLIAAAAVLALGLALWLGAAQARRWRIEAEGEMRGARAELALARRVAARPVPTGAAPVIEAAEAAGLVLEAAPGRDGLEVSAASASSAQLFGWLAALEARGMGPSSLTVVENADATLQMQARF